MPQKRTRRSTPSARQIAAYLVQRHLASLATCTAAEVSESLSPLLGWTLKISEEKLAEIKVRLHRFTNDALYHALKAWNDFLDTPFVGNDIVVKHCPSAKRKEQPWHSPDPPPPYPHS